jgi:hypothetical protein
MPHPDVIAHAAKKATDIAERARHRAEIASGTEALTAGTRLRPAEDEITRTARSPRLREAKRLETGE